MVVFSMEKGGRTESIAVAKRGRASSRTFFAGKKKEKEAGRRFIAKKKKGASSA